MTACVRVVVQMLSRAWLESQHSLECLTLLLSTTGRSLCTVEAERMVPLCPSSLEAHTSANPLLLNPERIHVHVHANIKYRQGYNLLFVFHICMYVCTNLRRMISCKRNVLSFFVILAISTDSFAAFNCCSLLSVSTPSRAEKRNM